jgi:SAM-dependent methyltransferase
MSDQSYFEWEKYGSRLVPQIYRNHSLDLSALKLSDYDLAAHFYRFGHREPRVFGTTNSTAEYLAMKWLRGRGLEIGAGRFPTKLFGSTVCEYADVDGGEAFGTQGIGHRLSIDCPIPEKLLGSFDFVIASHVLEHADGVIQSISNCLDAIKPGGIVYIVVPDRAYLEDAKWMPSFSFDHHIAEFHQPGLNDHHHDDLALSHMRANAHTVRLNLESRAGKNDLIASGGQISAMDLGLLLDSPSSGALRFMLHKHTYDFDGWISLLVDIQRFLKKRFLISEMRYGMERFDCHFVLKRFNE